MQENFDRQLTEKENTINSLQEENKLFQNKISADEQDLINLQNDLRELKIRLESEERLKEQDITSFEKEAVNGN